MQTRRGVDPPQQAGQRSSEQGPAPTGVGGHLESGSMNPQALSMGTYQHQESGQAVPRVEGPQTGTQVPYDFTQGDSSNPSMPPMTQCSSMPSCSVPYHSTPYAPYASSMPYNSMPYNSMPYSMPSHNPSPNPALVASGLDYQNISELTARELVPYFESVFLDPELPKKLAHALAHSPAAHAHLGRASAFGMQTGPDVPTPPRTETEDGNDGNGNNTQ